MIPIDLWLIAGAVSKLAMVLVALPSEQGQGGIVILLAGLFSQLVHGGIGIAIIVIVIERFWKKDSSENSRSLYETKEESQIKGCQ